VPDPESEQAEQLPELLSVSLRPDDPFAKRLLGASVRTNNLLLKVTVPKRTGRKRKRGSSGPFVASDTVSNQSKTNSPYITASDVFRSLQDNASKYTITPIGVLDESHRFRGKHLPTKSSVFNI
jgi:general transcription factor 3C polypeptide 5 (transcription factor C subunit 1)